MGVIAHRCAVLGMPIDHSLSPVLHRAAYATLNLPDWWYERVEMGQEGLARFLSSLDGSWAGLSLTMPLKRTVMPYGEPSDHWSRTLGVANTVVIDHSPPAQHGDDAEDARIENCANHPALRSRSRLRLFNTDVDGIRLALIHAWAERGITVPGAGDRAGQLDVVILGNGNTALSALAACSMLSAHLSVRVAARHPEAGAGLRRFAEMDPRRFDFTTMPLDAVCPALQRADIVISTLPSHVADPVARAWGTSASRPDHRIRNNHATLLDVVYDPRPSALVTQWRRTGGLAIGGEEMLLYQAMLQVMLMTGKGQRTPQVILPTDSSSSDRSIQVRASSRTPSVDIRLENAMRTALQEVL